MKANGTGPHLAVLRQGVVTVALVVSLREPAFAQWNHLGLSGIEVRQLRATSGALYACTNNGLFRKPSATAESSWVMLGFAGKRVHDLLQASPDTLLAAIEITGTGPDTVAIWRSLDGGNSWNAFQNGFGADDGPSHRKVFAFRPVNGAIVAASTGRISKSVDGGTTWYSVTQGGTFKFLASGATTLWAGGSTPISTAFAKRSIDSGETWVTKYGSNSSSAALAMAPDPANPDAAFLGLDGFIVFTSNGSSWTNINPPDGPCAYRAIASRSLTPLRLYANGADPPNGATVFKSADGGFSWTPISYPQAANGRVWVLEFSSGAAADTVFAGTGSGVLRYIHSEVVGVAGSDRNPQLILRAEPNPVTDRAALVFELHRTSFVSIDVFDVKGRLVARVLRGTRAAGLHRIAWSPSGLSSGAYICRLRAGSYVADRLVLVRD